MTEREYKKPPWFDANIITHQLALQVAEQMQDSIEEDIDAWAERLADSVCNLTD